MGVDAEATAQVGRAAQRRLAEWRGQAPFEHDEWWQRRLTSAGLDPGAMGALLAASGEAIRARCPAPPSWLCDLNDAFSGAFSGPEAAPPPSPQGTFAPIVAPLLAGFHDRVLQRARALVGEHPEAPFAPEAATNLLYASLPRRIDMLMARTVVLEMQVAALTEPLAGDTPEERFGGFVAGLSAPERALGLLREYPVLARLLAQTVRTWADTSIELLERLAADWPQIRAAYCQGEDPGRWSEISSDLGDLHGGGRAVRSLRFESGFRVLYKPRPMGIDVWFEDLLAWLEARGAPTLRVARALDRGDYGWAEFVAPEPCDSGDGVARFYERQGALLALLYAINANDIHHENLMAAGEHPVLVDVESLCGADYGHSNPDNYESAAEFEFDRSVMRVMLLPYFQEGLGGNLVDTSGIGGGDEGQLSAHIAPHWEGWGTDEMRLVYQRSEIQSADNRPRLAGESVHPSQYAGELERGFADMYRLLMTLRDELLGEGSLVAGLAELDARVVLRASQFYGFILRDSTHPDLLRNAVDRDRHFDRLWFGIDRSKFADLSERILPSERVELWRGDIPSFRTKVGSRDLWTGAGEREVEFFHASGLDAVHDKLRGLDEDDLKRQRWFLWASLTALARELDEPRYHVHHTPTPVSRDQLVSLATTAAERLSELAMWGQHGASWLGVAWSTGERWRLRPLEYDFYTGLPGIALFLAYAGDTLGRDEFSELARGAVATLRRQLDRRPRMVRYLGSYEGWGGLIYTWLHLAALWQDDALIEEARGFLPKIAPLIASDKELDIMRGSTGGIIPLLHLHRRSGDEEALRLAGLMGDRLIETALPFGAGKGWVTSAAPHNPLTGLSHGASGMAWALTELHAATEDERYRALAREAVGFERGFFSPDAGNWCDLRAGVDDTGKAKRSEYMAAWCHGAGGIALSRLMMLGHDDRPELRAEAEIALDTTVRKGLRFGHCLCHGDAGVLDVLLHGERVLGAPRWRAAIDEHLPVMLASIAEHGFIGGVPLNVETPGLMDGIAGIGYGLLRLAHPDRLPSVLALEPPRRRPS
ncbi:type 2 lanthipeptide synthetase LanM family protein [Haliangium sp.]|uniref:type 2 lanthipeptide synthetase LanM family protein n=1 Tax=Haliangium sp. TaxID=2663208 RepID=UPI003D1203F4